MQCDFALPGKEVANRYQDRAGILTDIDAHRSTIFAFALGGIADYREGGEVTGTGIGAFVVLVICFLRFPPRGTGFSRGGATTGGVARRGLPPLSAGKYVAILPFRVLWRRGFAELRGGRAGRSAHGKIISSK